jgi:hypothetical protein
MIKLIAGIAAAVVALCGLLTILYKNYFSPVAKMKRAALKDGKKAIDDGDISAINSAISKIKRRFLVVLVLLCAGCMTKPVVLYPVEQIDIIRVKKGEAITAPKDGYFLSDMYFKDVLEAKVLQ